VRFLVQWLIDWPRRVAWHLGWLAPLFARFTVGWVFLWSGWGKLHDLAQVTENFVGWGIPYPRLLTPFVSGVEFFGGLFLLLGFMTRISAIVHSQYCTSRALRPRVFPRVVLSALCPTRPARCDAMPDLWI